MVRKMRNPPSPVQREKNLARMRAYGVEHGAKYRAQPRKCECGQGFKITRQTGCAKCNAAYERFETVAATPFNPFRKYREYFGVAV